jgi:CubicO group peptidase (beta-lactamase class C family)
MRLYCLALLFLLGSCITLRANEPARLTQPQVDRLVAQAMKQWSAPGLAIAVVQLPDPSIVKGYGIRQLLKPELVTTETLFPIASCTKSFTSSLFAQLVDEGKIGWDEPVQKHWPEFAWSDRHVSALTTVRDLLSHRSGIAGHDLLWYRAPWDLEEVIRRTQKLPVEGQFRQTYHYSSLPVIAAGKLAEKVAKKPWDELIRTKLAEPLGLEPITFTTAEMHKVSNRAMGHVRNANGEVELMPEYILREPNPAGSIGLSVSGLAKWLSFQLQNGMAGRQIVTEKNLLQTRTSHVFMPRDDIIGPLYPLSKQVSYCMGWVQFDYRGVLVYAHGGIIDGFRCQLTLIPERKLGIAIVNNLHESKLNIALTYALIDEVFAAKGTNWFDMFWKAEQAERLAKREALRIRDQQRRLGTSPSLPLSQYTGEFTNPGYGTSTVTLKNDKLTWKWSSFTSELEHYQFDLFRIKEGYFADQLVEFGGVSGKVSGLFAVGQTFSKK